MWVAIYDVFRYRDLLSVIVLKPFINQKCQIQCDLQSNLCTEGCAVYGTFDTYQYNIYGVNYILFYTLFFEIKLYY